jgi:cystathionine beta-lyase
MRPETLLITHGGDPKSHEGIVNTPVYRASTVVFSSLDELERMHRGENTTSPYGRFGTRTSVELERSLAALDGADNAIVLSSGLSAIFVALTAFLNAGDHLLVVDSVYQPVRTLCNEELKRFGVETTFFDPSIGVEISSLIRPNTKVIYLESPGSLTFQVQDIPAITRVAHQHKLVVLHDSTWGTPLLMRPFELGIDISIHSATKYIGGHSDLMMGVLTCKEAHHKRLLTTFRNTGPCVSPDACYLAQRGLRTLAVRLKQHDANARAVALWLRERAEVAVVLHPALSECPGHEFWKRDFTGACGLFSFVLKEPIPRERLAAMLDNLELFHLGYSWGGFESLIIPFDPRPMRTATPWPYRGQAFRLHVGLENVEDLIADLQRGLERLAL